MARRWLLTVLTTTALSVGLAGTASAQEVGQALTDPVAVDAEVATATVSADAAERTIEAEVTTDVEVEELDTDVEPTVTATVSEEGPGLAVDPTTEVAGEDPVTEATGALEGLVPEPVGKIVNETAPTQQSDVGDGVSPATKPAPAPAGSESASASAPAPAAGPATVQHSNTISADRAARGGLRSGMTGFSYDDAGELSPMVAPPEDAEPLPLVAAAAPTTDLALPIIDSTPTVPGLLRLLAGLMVVAAAATWRTVRNELA